MLSAGVIVTCIYSGIFAWNPSGDEYIENVPVQCKILKVGDFKEHIRVDCRKGLKKWRLANSQLNWAIGWVDRRRS